MENISVIIPTYNREKLIARAINSVLKQSYSVSEIIIIDDCSQDNTRQIISAFCDNRIKYYKNETNIGAAASRNLGVTFASSPIIAFLDSDDIWHCDKLKLQMDYWEKHPEYSMIYCSYLLHRLDGSDCKVPYLNTCGNLEGNLFHTLLLNNTIGTPTILAKKEAFLSIDGFDTSLQALEDWDMVLRFSSRYLIGYVDTVLVDAYLQPSGISSKSGAFYDCRCKMIANNKTALLEANLFDTAVSQLLQHAKKNGVLSGVERLLAYYLTSS